MARKRNRKARITIPSPEEIRRAREAAEVARLERDAYERQQGKKVENWGINEDGTQRFSGVTIIKDKRGKPRGAWRSNPFNWTDRSTLRQELANAGQHLMDIYAAGHGLDGSPEARYDMVEGGWGQEDRKVFWSTAYYEVIATMSKASGAIMEALIFALVEEDRPSAWQGIVSRATGRNLTPQRASERLIVACEELMDITPEVIKRLRAEQIKKAA